MEVLDRVDPQRIRDLLGRDEFFWLDLTAPAAEDVKALGALLGLPPLAIEDSLEFGQRPKVDDYGDRVLVVFYGADAGEDLVEVHLHVSGSWVVTLHRDHCTSLDRPRSAVAQHHARDELDLVFRILDALADSLSALLDRAGDVVDDLQERAFERPEPAIRREVAEMRGALFRLGQILAPQRVMLEQQGDLLEMLPGLQGEAARHPFREVHDVLVQAVGRVEYLRELLNEALGIYLSSTSNQLNALATRLSLLGTIFLPLTFVTGFFGQNFGYLVRHIDTKADFLIWTIGPTVVVLVLGLWLGLVAGRRR